MSNISAIAPPPDSDEGNKGVGQWKKGTSGNPAGRPPGSRNRASIMMEGLLEGQAEQLVQKLVACALEGNTHALAICFDRLMPRCKERTIQFDTPPINNYGDVLEAADTIFKGIAKGEITPSEGEKLTTVLQFQFQTAMALERQREQLSRKRETDEKK